MRRKKYLGLSLLLFGLFFIVGSLIDAIEPISAQNQARGEPQETPLRQGGDCLLCHDNPVVNAVFDTPHGLAVTGSSSTTTVCANCHGASTQHASAMQSPEVVFSEDGRFPTSEIALQNSQCLGCHRTSETVHWAASVHQSADMSCASCHQIHVPRQTALLQRSDPALCLNCHLEQRSQLNRRSHHPVAEGLMSCSSCHNPHGSATVALLAKPSVNDTCTSCHEETRGPFLWEHQPVTEDCSSCHEPHGSNQASLLSIRQPYLCQSCHSEPFHPSSLYSGTGLSPAGAQQSLLGNSCTNCHSRVHGSNHPSGSRLTR